MIWGEIIGTILESIIDAAALVLGWRGFLIVVILALIVIGVVYWVS